MTDVQELWNKFAIAMAQDYMYRGVGQDDAVAMAYVDVADQLVS